MQKLYDLITEQGDYTDYSVNSDNMSGGNEINNSPDEASGLPDSSNDQVKSVLKTISDSIDKLQQLNPDFLQSDSVKKIMTDMMSICQMQMSDNSQEELSPSDQDELHADQNYGVEDDSVKMFESKQFLMNQFKRFL